MLYMLRLLIGAQKSINSNAEENHKLMVGFCLQALEMSRHRLYAPKDSITHREQEWLIKLENFIVDFLHNCSADDAEDAVVMYIDAIKRGSVKFYAGAYPLVLIEVLCYLCTKNERLKASRGRELVQICAEILLSLGSCVNKLSLTTDFFWEGLLIRLMTHFRLQFIGSPVWAPGL